MRRFIAPALALVLGMSAVVAADPAPKLPDPKDPTSAIMTPVALLRSNDFKGFYELMPAEDQAKAQAEWDKARTETAAGKASEGKDSEGKMAEFNAFMAKCLAPDAVDQLMLEAEPKLVDMKPDEVSQGLQMMGAMLPMMAMQGQGGKKADPEQQQLMGAVGGMMMDASQWVLTAGIDDPKKLRSAIEKLVAGAKALGVKDSKDLQALPLDEFLGRLGPVVKEMKAALAIYDLQLDPLLDSVKATAKGEGNERSLAVSFKAFGKPYALPVKVELKDGHWMVSPKNAKGLPGGNPMGGDAGGENPAMPMDPK